MKKTKKMKKPPQHKVTMDKREIKDFAKFAP